MNFQLVLERGVYLRLICIVFIPFKCSRLYFRGTWQVVSLGYQILKIKNEIKEMYWFLYAVSTWATVCF